MRPELLNVFADGSEAVETDESATWIDPIARHMRATLQMVGLKATPQTLALSSLLFIAGDRHVTVDMLDREASAMDFPLTPETIAATLRDFAGAGLLREIALYGETVWYDTNTGSHFHFYDEDAKLLFDIPDAMIPLLKMPDLPEIDVVGVDLIIRIRRKHDGALAQN